MKTHETVVFVPWQIGATQYLFRQAILAHQNRPFRKAKRIGQVHWHLTIAGTAALEIFFHAAFDLCSANGNNPDTLFDKPDFGFAFAVFQNRTMMIEAESDSLMQYDRSPAARWTGGVLPSRWMWMMTRRFWVTKGGIRIARTAERSKRRS